MPSYTSPTPAVLAVRHASTGKGVDLTYVRSVVRPLGIRPYLCQVGRKTAGAPILASDQLPASEDEKVMGWRRDHLIAHAEDDVGVAAPGVSRGEVDAPLHPHP
ncbi:hypothetical protein GW17_00029889 [Ensete ventricosum]|nr:hypothetical protein GW17_00029889 [Ensete ventricosum]